LLGFTGPFFFNATDSVVRLMGSAYPDLIERKAYVSEVVRNEEERFADTLDRGLALLEQEIKSLRQHNQAVLSGDVAFRLYDTYGFPLDLTEDFLSSEGLSLDRVGFDRAMEEQRARAREGQKGTVYIKSGGVGGTPSHFVGDRIVEWESEILATLVNDETRTNAIRAGEEVEIIVTETPFYGESGGQVGDTGRLETSRGDLVEILDTQKPQPSLIVHRGRVTRGAIQVGDRVRLVIDEMRRNATRLNHSGTHILHSALREVLGTHVRQAGSLVAPDRLRFDFTHTSAVKDEALQRIEDLANTHIRENAEVTSEEMSLTEALKSGALAFFGEKYGERVRVLRMGDFSVELCGGTHVSRTGDIGLFKLKTESGVASGVRRIEAATGEGALEWIRQREQVLKEISHLLKGTEEDATDKIERLLAQQRDLEKKITQLQTALAGSQGDDIAARAHKLDGVSVVASRVEGVDDKGLRELADRLRDKLHPAVIVLGALQGDRVVLLAAVSKDAAKKYHAGNIIKQIAPLVGGGGGGRPDFAQAGGKDPTRLDEALQKVYELVKKGA
jgi:alanyl-tRNA synthetase